MEFILIKPDGYFFHIYNLFALIRTSSWWIKRLKICNWKTPYSCCSIFQLIAASRQSWITSCWRKYFVLVTCSTINIHQLISAQYCCRQDRSNKPLILNPLTKANASDELKSAKSQIMATVIIFIFLYFPLSIMPWFAFQTALLRFQNNKSWNVYNILILHWSK